MVKKRLVAPKVPPFRLGDHTGLHWPPGLAPNPPWAGPSMEVPDPLHVVLAKVELVEDPKPGKRHLTLTGTYHGSLYRTTLKVEDRSLLTNLWKSLGTCLGETIAAIGSHRVDRSLNRV